MSQPASLREVLADLKSALQGEGIRWYVFGAQAVNAYGRPRMTADVDVTIESPLERAKALLIHLQRSGFALRVGEWEPFLERTRVLPLVHDPTATPVDVVFAGPGVEIDFLDHARELDLDGLAVPVISPEDLIASKILAGRPKDIEDARSVLAEQADHLDLERTRHWLRLFEEALGRSDLLRELERLQEG